MLVNIEGTLVSEMTQAAFAPEFPTFSFVDVAHESRKRSDPRVMAVPVKKIDALRVIRVTYIERITALPLVVEKRKETDIQL